jgi:hypothetical protein
MPTITFEPTGVDAGWSFSLDGEAPPDALDFGPGLGWAVKVSNKGTVRLATGGALEKLQGRVWFSVGTATPEGREVYQEGTPPKWGILAYDKADENPDHYLMLPEAYDLSMHVSRSMYEALQMLVAARTLPTISVNVGSRSSFGTDGPPLPERDAIRYGWEPDGSGLDWGNQNFPHLEIRWCAFRVNVGLLNVEDDETQPDRGTMSPTRNDLGKILESVMLSVRRIEQLGRSVAVPLWIAVILLGILVFRR